MKTRDRKPTPEQLTAAQETIAAFFDDYPYATQAELSFEVLGTCGLCECNGLSANRTKVMEEYIMRSDDALAAARLLADPVFLEQQYSAGISIDKEKVQAIRKRLSELSKPFWKEEADGKTVGNRLIHEQVRDALALDEADKEALLSQEIGLHFFMQYGLKESLELLDNLFACFEPFKGLGKARQREIADFYAALKDLLSATYLQSIERWKELREVEEGGGDER